jgi:hypothetical protein
LLIWRYITTIHSIVIPVIWNIWFTSGMVVCSSWICCQNHYGLIASFQFHIQWPKENRQKDKHWSIKHYDTIIVCKIMLRIKYSYRPLLYMLHYIPFNRMCIWWFWL